MANCKFCGVEVFWALMEGRRTPVQFLGDAWTWNRNDPHAPLVKRPVVTTHRCDPNDTEAYDKMRQAREDARRAKAEADEHAWRTARARAKQLRQRYEADRRDAVKVASKVDCRKCGAKAGDGCENLVERNKGNVAFTRWPHIERVLDANPGALT